MMKRIKVIATSLITAAMLALPLAVTASSLAYAADDPPAATPTTGVDPGGSIGQGITDAGGDKTAKSNKLDVNLKVIVNVLLYALGAISVIMIVIGGIRYATSGGDTSAITGAKNTILYSVVGLVVALLAYAIVNWVVGAFVAPPPKP